MNLIIFTISVIINLTIIYYLYNLSQIGCKCAMNYKRTYILSYTSCLIILGAITTFVKVMPKFLLVVSIPLLILAIINIVFTIQYVDEMKKINCDCSESVIRTMMYILAIINIFSWIITLLLFLFVLFSIYRHPKSKKLFTQWRI